MYEKSYPLKLLKENIGETFQDIGTGNFPE
jgi:hypothetical protein